MKKITLLFTLFLASLTTMAQITITDPAQGVTIADGDNFSFSTLGQKNAEVQLKITNNGSNTVNIMAEVTQVTNSDGTNLQFCLGDTCFNTISAGATYPQNGALTLAPGGSNNDFDHFFNSNPGTDPNQPVVYGFRFFEVDANGNEIGDILSFTYTYDSSLSTKNYNLKDMGVNLMASTFKQEISFNAQEIGKVSLYDLTGKRIVFQNYQAGQNTLFLGDLKSGVYLLGFETKNQKATLKVVKK
ncbi:T9SS type A sorting domain-containing protein [Mesonia sediminis]|uniref:T9SS type A sorting domain-containing protein n=1 Tax=Mesonia sediminis TaxID=1703946 RepID=A0ABW5SHB1_9FLAO